MFYAFLPLDIDWIATEMRPLSNEPFVVFEDKVVYIYVNVCHFDEFFLDTW